MKLPGFGRRTAPTDADAGVDAELAPKAGRLPWVSLNTLAIALFLAGALVIIVQASYQQRAAVMDAHRAEQRHDQLRLEAAAERILTWSRGEAARLQWLGAAARQALVEDDLSLARAEQRLRGWLGEGEELLLQPVNGSRWADPAREARLSYAEQDMAQRLLQGEAVAAEVHRPGSEAARLVSALQLPDADGQPLLQLFWRRPDDGLQALLPQTRAPFALRQRVGGGIVTLARRGESPQGVLPAQLPIRGTSWELAHWPLPPPTQPLWGRYLAVVAGAVALWLLLVAAALGWLMRVWRRDQASLISALHDALNGELRPHYRLHLRESGRALASLRVLLKRQQQAGDGRASAPPAGPGDELRTLAEFDAALGRGGDPPDDPSPAEADDNWLAFDLHPSQSPQPEVSEVSLDPSIFRAYDVRGIVGESLTPDVVFHLGQAIGSEAIARGEHSIAVARDGRLSGPELADALIRGLMAAGQTVLEVGQAPTPVLYFAAKYLNTSSGVMVTGSHNPPDYNGFKIVLAGDTLANEDIQALRRRMETQDFHVGEGRRQPVAVLGDYIERIVADVRPARALKVVVDCGNGVAGEAAPRLLRALGCEVIPLYCEIDGRFPNHHPDPSRPENLKDLVAAVAEHRADLGLGFDGDGDRVGVVDARGHIIWPDRLMMLYARDILARNPGGHIIFDVKCSRHLREQIEAAGGVAEMWKTGHSLIKRRMRETNALLAGEMSGHIFFEERWYGFDDALYASARLIEILAADARSSDAVFAELPEGFSTPELNVPMQEGEPHPFVAELAKQADFGAAEVTSIDGLRADYPDGWGLVRASNTTPCLVLRFEANDPDALARIQAQFRSRIQALRPDLKLPF